MDDYRSFCLTACCGVFYLVCLAFYAFIWYLAWFHAEQYRQTRLAYLEERRKRLGFIGWLMPKETAGIWSARLAISIYLIFWLLVGAGVVYFWFTSTH